MLRFLSIVNFAVIPQLRVEFHEGLNLLTGETGAGKSIIVDALSLLLGARASSEIIRTGERVALLEGTFELVGRRGAAVRDLLGSIGITLGSTDDLTVRRELQSGGRGRIFVNDRNVTVATLRALQPYLVEIHGQGEQQALAAPRAQLRLLDTFANCLGLQSRVAEAYGRWKDVMESLRAFNRDETERARTLDLLRYQLAEFERIDPKPEEDETLAAEKSLLAHAERAVELNANAFAALYESDESILARLASVRRWLQDLQLIDARVTPIIESVDTATVALTDASDGLRQHSAGLSSSPERLAEIEHRLTELERLKRKYGRTLKGLQEVSEDLRARLHELEHWTERENELETARTVVEKEYEAAAGQLTACRSASAPHLEERVTAELGNVALERARFYVRLETAQAHSGWPEEFSAEEGESASLLYWTPRGADRVQFLFSANPGEEARPLNRVASGGELSRLMLILRTVAHQEAAGAKDSSEGGTLVFDEIDAGIGGRAAESVGRRLKALADTQQVLCVTHQSQIARFADHHYAVEKQVSEGRTVTLVREVEAEARIGELARMIGGSEEIETARETARWMIESAARQQHSPGKKRPGKRQGTEQARARRST
ncbi:MAG TPA: DNA repair protein RecN, partial [Pyrinomonadaceae bacterium]